MIIHDITRYLPYIGYQIEGATTDNEKITDIFLEDNQIICVIDDDYEAIFDCVILDLCNGKSYIRIK